MSYFYTNVCCIAVFGKVRPVINWKTQAIEKTSFMEFPVELYLEKYVRLSIENIWKHIYYGVKLQMLPNKFMDPLNLKLKQLLNFLRSAVLFQLLVCLTWEFYYRALYSLDDFSLNTGVIGRPTSKMYQYDFEILIRI